MAWTDEEELRDANESGSGYLFGIARDANKFADPRRQIKLYRHAQPAPVVDADDNFYSWFGREWHENYQHNQYTTAAKQMLGVMAESAWKAGHRAAMLQAEPVTTTNKLGNSPVIPDGYVMVPKVLTEEMIAAAMNCEDVIFNSDDSFCVQFGNIYDAMLAAAPQEVSHD